MAESSPHLPHDVLFHNILSKLPVKPLYQFKSVSKLWNATISCDPCFAKSHLSWAKQMSTSSIIGVFSHVVDQDTHECIFVKEDGTDLFRFQCRRFSRLVGHCNGLFCFRSGSSFYICNPCTRDLLYLSSPPLSPKTENASFGFGFDAFENKYKVVQIFHTSPDDYQCMIYTLGGSSYISWKDITIASGLSIQLNRCTPPHLDKPGPFFNADRRLYINGKFYWYFYFFGMFLAFDVHHEKFECLDGPGPMNSLSANFRKSENLRMLLTEWQEYVCLAFSNGDETHLYKYKMHHDWKLLEVSKLPRRTGRSISAFGYSRPNMRLSYKQDEYIKVVSNGTAKHFPLPVGLVGLDQPKRPGVTYNLVLHIENVVSLKAMVQAGTSQANYVENSMSAQVKSVSTL